MVHQPFPPWILAASPVISFARNQCTGLLSVPHLLGLMLQSQGSVPHLPLCPPNHPVLSFYLLTPLPTSRGSALLIPCSHSPYFSQTYGLPGPEFFVFSRIPASKAQKPGGVSSSLLFAPSCHLPDLRQRPRNSPGTPIGESCKREMANQVEKMTSLNCHQLHPASQI